MRRLLVAGGLGVWLCACAIGPDYKRPVVDVPPAFRGRIDAAAPEHGTPLGDLRWWEVFERRPDIRQAEAQLVAANANIGVAKALFFPQITLTASAGLQSAALSRLFEGPSGFWAFAGQLLQPVFQGGRIWFNFQASKARQQEALLADQQVIKTAFREVSDALVAYRRTCEFRSEQEALTDSLHESARLSTIRYRGGVSSYLEVLDADARLFSAELDLARARREELLAVVQLYKTLGGGWRIDGAVGVLGGHAQSDHPRRRRREALLGRGGPGADEPGRTTRRGGAPQGIGRRQAPRSSE